MKFPGQSRAGVLSGLANYSHVGEWDLSEAGCFDRPAEADVPPKEYEEGIMQMLKDVALYLDEPMAELKPATAPEPPTPTSKKPQIRK